MVKNTIVLLLCVAAVQAADGFKPITPSDFNEEMKNSLMSSIAIWVEVAKKENIPLDKGLAKQFVTMQSEGVEKLIHNEKALACANEYLKEFLSSKTAKYIKKLGFLKPDGQGNYDFNGAPGYYPDMAGNLWLYELCNIIHKRGALWKMPADGRLFAGFIMPSDVKACAILPLNEDNESIPDDALRGQGLLTAYFKQQKQ